MEKKKESQEPQGDLIEDALAAGMDTLRQAQGEDDVVEKKAVDEAAQLKDQLLRAMAEMENLRKRVARERDEARKFAVADFARDVLSVADNFARAMSAAPDVQNLDPAIKGVLDGVQMTQKELLGTLEKHGIRKIEPSPGDAFDYNLHQAMFEVPTDAHPPGVVVEVATAGYVLHDRLLRPAMVGVSKAGGAGSVDTEA